MNKYKITPLLKEESTPIAHHKMSKKTKQQQTLNKKTLMYSNTIYTKQQLS